MKYVCPGHIGPGKFENMPGSKRNAMVDGRFAYDDVLRRNGNFAGGEALQPAGSAVTLRFQGDKVMISDGPFEIRPAANFNPMIRESEHRRNSPRLQKKGNDHA
jgi:hypothetical protein